MKYKLLIIIAALLLIAWLGITIYHNAQPRPKKAIELNDKPDQVVPTIQPTQETPAQPTSQSAPATQKTATALPVQSEAIAIQPPEIGGLEKKDEPATSQPFSQPFVTVIATGTNGQYTQLCLAYKRGETWVSATEAARVCK